MSVAEPVGALARAMRAPTLPQFATDLIRYGACSAAALTLDYGLLLLLTYGFAVPYLTASAIGFMSGLCLAYLSSIAFVFKGRRRLTVRREFLGFSLIGIAGLVLTQLLLALLVGGAGLSVAVAKPITAVVVFLFNFGLRRGILFASKAAA